MRITENFVNPRFGDIQQISLHLVHGEDDGPNRVDIHISGSNPSIRLQDIGTLIGMLEALKRRAGA